MEAARFIGPQPPARAPSSSKEIPLLQRSVPVQRKHRPLVVLWCWSNSCRTKPVAAAVPKSTAMERGISMPSSMPNSRFACPLPKSEGAHSPKMLPLACQGRSGGSPGDEFGYYPWNQPWQPSDSNAIEWIQDDLVTLFTTDGLVQIGGSLVPRVSSSVSERKQFRGRAPFRSRRVKEEDYMDPKQGLCLGAIFDIVATNGLDSGRKLCVFGYCRSIEMLSDVIEDTVLEQGGEVVIAEKCNAGGLNEKLLMTVAVPFLWGVPPAVDSLNYAIRCGGGIVEKISREWEFF